MALFLRRSAAAVIRGEERSCSDVVGAARLALMLEGIAAAAYLSAIPTLRTPGAIELASSIQPVDM